MTDLRNELERIVQHYDARSELYASDADCAEALAAIAGAALSERPTSEVEAAADAVAHGFEPPYAGDDLERWGREMAASEAADCVCADCGEPYGSSRFPDLVIPHAMWAKISPSGDEGGLLCPGCINARLEAIGASNVFGRFTSGPMALDPPQTAVADLITDAIVLASDKHQPEIHGKLCEALDLLSRQTSETQGDPEDELHMILHAYETGVGHGQQGRGVDFKDENWGDPNLAYAYRQGVAQGEKTFARVATEVDVELVAAAIEEYSGEVYSTQARAALRAMGCKVEP